MRSIKVLDPCMDIRGMEDEETWEANEPIHPKPLVYAKIATGVVKMMASLAETENKRRRNKQPRGAGRWPPRPCSKR
jgi:hypothetical protein